MWAEQGLGQDSLPDTGMEDLSVGSDNVGQQGLGTSSSLLSEQQLGTGIHALSFLALFRRMWL